MNLLRFLSPKVAKSPNVGRTLPCLRAEAIIIVGRYT
jgi:hypothetical protein